MEDNDNKPTLRNYLMQVYGILTGALVITMATTYASITMGTPESVVLAKKTVMAPPMVAMVANHTVLMLMAFFGVFFGLMFVMRNLKAGLVGLALFSAVEGVFLGPMVYLATTHVGSTLSAHPVRDAVALTLVAFGALSSYVIVKGADFRPMGGFLFMALLVAIAIMLGFALTGAVVPLLFNGLVVLLFFGFVLYDTSNLIYGNRDAPVEDAIGLYLDMMNIFIHLLSILKSDD